MHYTVDQQFRELGRHGRRTLSTLDNYGRVLP
jgi:hypothetical protein